MIIKKLKRTSFKKSKSVMIGGLVDYILAEHDDRGKDKLAYAGSRNFLTTTVAAQKREMISLAEESIQSRMPVTHWIMSWQENEQPSREQVDEAVSLFLRGMGLAEHQTFYALHTPEFREETIKEPAHQAIADGAKLLGSLVLRALTDEEFRDAAQKSYLAQKEKKLNP